MIPAPPNSHPTLHQEHLKVSQRESTLGNEQPKIKNSGELTHDEQSFILDTTLKAKHRSEASILSFIDSFIRCKNIAQASSEAGIHASLGYRYRHTKDIALAIQKLIDRSAIKYGFDASEIIERTKEMVDFDPISVQNPDGTFKSNFHDIPPEARRNIKKLKARNLWGETEDMNGVKSKIIIGEIIEYEFYDKLKAIDLVGKEKDLFKTTTKVEHTVSADMASILLEATKRGAQASLAFKQVREIEGEVVNGTDT